LIEVGPEPETTLEAMMITKVLTREAKRKWTVIGEVGSYMRKNGGEDGGRKVDTSYLSTTLIRAKMVVSLSKWPRKLGCAPPYWGEG
jgi:hypothetical protein